MIANKLTASKICLSFGVLLFVVPVAIDGLMGIRADDYLAFTGVPNSGELVFFIPAVFIFIAGALLFPFREEEAWECVCGYDLSYMNKKSKHCPECGAKIQLEWSAQQGLPRKTINRLWWAVLLFGLSIVLFVLGIVFTIF